MQEDTILNNLINSLKNGNEADRLYAIEELKEYPNAKAIPVLVTALADANSTIRSTAEDLLNTIDPNWSQLEMVEEGMDYFIGKLNHRSKEVWRSASKWLVQLEKQSLPFLINQLEEAEDEEVRWKIILILKQIEGDTQIAVPSLIKSIASNNLTIKENAIQALAETNSRQKEVLEVLGNCLEDEHANIRVVALKALTDFGEQLGSLSFALVKCLLDKEEKVRAEAEQVLLQAGVVVVEDLLTLVKQRKDLLRLKMEELRQTKGELFKGVDQEKFLLEPDKALQNVKWHLVDIMSDLTVVDAAVSRAVRILGRLPEGADNRVAVLGEILKDANPKLIEASIKSIGVLGASAKSRLSDLLQLYQQPNQTDYELIVQSLNAIEPDWPHLEEAQPFLNFLTQCLGKSEERETALLAFRSMDHKVVQHLVKGLDLKDRVIKKEIIFLLGALGTHAKEALPLLKLIATEEDNRLLREASKEAAKKIGFE